MREVSNVFFPLKLLRFQTNFKGGGKGLAKGSMSRRSGQQAGGGEDESESAGRHERSFDQGVSVKSDHCLSSSLTSLTRPPSLSSSGSSNDQAKYGSPSGEEEENVDLHNKVN